MSFLVCSLLGGDFYRESIPLTNDTLYSKAFTKLEDGSYLEENFIIRNLESENPEHENLDEASYYK